MPATILEPPERIFECLLCGRRVRVRDTAVAPRLHPCRGKATDGTPMNGLVVPFIQITARSGELDRKANAVRRVDREDYVGTEIVRTDKTGRPAMAVYTDRADGSNDAHVFAGGARVFTPQQ